MSRDPLYEVGSIPWTINNSDNDIDNLLFSIETLEKLVEHLEGIFGDVFIGIEEQLAKYKLSLNYEKIKRLTNTDQPNPYDFTGNNSIDNRDRLGLNPFAIPFITVGALLKKALIEGAISSLTAAIATAVLNDDESWCDIFKSALIAFPGGVIGGWPGPLGGSAGNATTAFISGLVEGKSSEKIKENVYMAALLGFGAGFLEIDSVTNGIIGGASYEVEQLNDATEKFAEKVEKDVKQKAKDAGCEEKIYK